MNQDSMRYNLFRTVERDVIVSLKQSRLGNDLMRAIDNYHKMASDLERIPLPDSMARDFVKHQLAWRFFNEHDATLSGLTSKIKRMMAKYSMSYEKVCSAYVGRAYTDVRARLVLRDLRSRGMA